MGCVVHTDAFRDLLAGKDAAVQQEAGVFQPFQVHIFYGGGSHVFAENAGQIGMADWASPAGMMKASPFFRR